MIIFPRKVSVLWATPYDLNHNHIMINVSIIVELNAQMDLVWHDGNPK
ncbi:MAG: hypothetical protein OEV74_00685 [Cyclobacteriaceae bacterium]|nr:hypothetical protein [Cyclobacteriaceae bacterium]MDH4294764.1 hypothetical protein [Cyclobacteriaceae bacterium]MDH5248613.1 hypothetical protein [Cyclobacteriaceae bacterium]